MLWNQSAPEGACGGEEYAGHIASRYFDALLHWYESAAVGVRGGDLQDAIVEKLASAGLRSALNLGHLVS